MLSLLLALTIGSVATSEILFSIVGNVEGMGALVAMVNGSYITGVTVDALRHGENPTRLCQIMGYSDYGAKFGSLAEFGLQNDDFEKLGRGITKVSCSSRALTIDDCFVYVEPERDATISTQKLAAIQCGGKHNPENYAVKSFYLVRENVGGNLVLGNPGMAVLEIYSEATGEEHYSVVCHADQRAADLACRSIGHRGARPPRRNKFEIVSKENTRYFNFTAHKVICGGAEKLEECIIDYTADAADDTCYQGYEIVVECIGDDDKIELDHIGLVRDGEKGDVVEGNPGVVYAQLKDGRVGVVLEANSHAMNAACRSMGYKSKTFVDRNYDYKYLSSNMTKHAHFVVREVYCPSDVHRDFTNCDVEIVRSDEVYIGDKQLVLGCDTEDDKHERKVSSVFLASTKGGNFHSRNPGVAMVSFDDGSYGFIASARPSAMNMLCRNLGYKEATFTDTNKDYKYLTTNYLRLGKYVLFDVDCPDGTRDYNDCKAKIVERDAADVRPDYQTVIGCDTDGDDFEVEVDSVFIANTHSGSLEISNVGVVFVSFNDGKYGFVASASRSVADLLCRNRGYKKATMVSRNQDFKHLSERYTRIADVVLYDVSCPSETKDYNDCKAYIRPITEADVEPDYQLVVGCDTEDGGDDKIELDHIGLVRDGEKGDVVEGNPGVVYAQLKDGRVGVVLEANSHAMNAACRSMGYKSKTFVDRNYDYKYLSSNMTKHAHFVVREVYCPSDVHRDFTNCDVEIVPSDEVYIGDKQLVLGCDTEDDKHDRKVTSVFLASTQGGEFHLGNPGVVIVGFSDKTYGFVESADQSAINLLCKNLGYKGASMFVDSNKDYRYLSAEYSRIAKVMLHQVSCPAGARDYNDCEAKILDNRETRPEYHMVVGCDIDDGHDDDSAGHVEIEFGGLKGNFEIDAQKIIFDLEELLG